MSFRSQRDLIAFLRKLITAYERGALGGTTHEVHPHLPSGSRENYLYFTLAPAINFQRPSEALWRAAERTYRDPQTRFVFLPEETERGRAEYLAAMTKYSLASFRDKHTDIWYRIALTTANDYGGDPRVFLASCDYDVETVRETLLRRRKDFPYLSGPKLANYWLYILTCFTDAPLRKRDAITIIPDVHVVRASVRLGVVSESVRDRIAVADTWKSLLSGTTIAPVDLHAPLWRWSRMGFPPVNEAEPI
jgi:hypothetical protein